MVSDFQKEDFERNLLIETHQVWVRKSESRDWTPTNDTRFLAYTGNQWNSAKTCVKESMRNNPTYHFCGAQYRF